MDHGGGGGSRSSSRLRDRLARIFRPGSLLRSTCNTTASTCSSSSAAPPKPQPPVGSSSRALLAADSFAASSRRESSAVGRTESFSTAVDRLCHRRGGAGVAPEPTLPSPARFSADAPPLLEVASKEKKSCSVSRHHRAKSDRLMTTKLLSANPYGFSSSDNDDDSDVFSSDDADDPGRNGGASKKLIGAETFFSSSRSFSSDSSEFYTTTTKKKKHTKSKSKSKSSPAPPSSKPPLPPSKPTGKHQRRHRRAASSGCDTCGVRDGFRPVVSAAEEQLRKGFAVVKRSRDPYGDFRSSMVEMIVGRQLFAAPDLERLLRSYLSLNAARHHPVILQAFSDIWVVLHGGG